MGADLQNVIFYLLGVISGALLMTAYVKRALEDATTKLKRANDRYDEALALLNEET